MTKEKQLELVAKYPKIFKNYGGDKMHTCMHWGIEFDDGWYDLIDKCLEKLQYFCDLCTTQEREVQVVADQMKEKYGTLRFYYTVYGGNDVEGSIISDIVEEAEYKSGRICEVSGDSGTLCQRGWWYKTLSYTEARKDGFIACCEETEEYWKQKDEKQSTTNNENNI